MNEKVDHILKFLSANFLLKRVYFLNRIRDFTHIYILITYALNCYKVGEFFTSKKVNVKKKRNKK